MGQALVWLGANGLTDVVGSLEGLSEKFATLFF